MRIRSALSKLKSLRTLNEKKRNKVFILVGRSIKRDLNKGALHQIFFGFDLPSFPSWLQNGVFTKYWQKYFVSIEQK